MPSNSASAELRCGFDLHSSSNRDLGYIRRTPLRCGAVSPQCSLVVAVDVACSLMSVALTAVQLAMFLAVQLVVQLVLGRFGDLASALESSCSLVGSFAFLTEWMVDTLRRRDNSLPLTEPLVSFLQMSDLGAASTDMLLLLSMLLLELSSKSSASCRLGVLVCTRYTFPTNRCDLTNLILSPLLSLSEDLSGGVAGFNINPCSCMKWGAFLSSADAKVLLQFFSKHLIDGHHLVP